MGIAQGIGIILDFFQRQEANSLAKEEWKTKKQQLDMAIEERDKRIQMINALPEELKPLAYIHPAGVGDILKMNALISTLGGADKQSQGQQFTPESSPEPYETPTGKFLPTQNQGLPQQIAQGQLGNPSDIAKDILYKEYGIGRQTEAVKSDIKMRLPDGRWVYGQILRNGKGVPTDIPVPPEWKETEVDTQAGQFRVLRNMVSGEIDWSSATPKAVEVTREKTTGGPTGIMNVPVPKLIMPGQQLPPGLPEPVKHEPLTMTGPKGEQETIYINPITGEPLKAQGQVGPPGVGPVSGGIKTKPAQPQQVTTSQQISMMQSGLEALKKIKDSIFDPNTGKINRTNLANAMVKTPRTEGKRVGDLIGAALNAIRLASTGAAFSQEELNQLKAQYIPSYLAKDEQVYDQWDMLGKFVSGMLQQLDPNEVFTKNQQEEFSKLIEVPRYKGGVNLQPGAKKPPSKYQKLSNEELLKQLEGQ